ncbi:mitochondrial ATP synthase epsilon chain-domain-containing protein [Gorgonomyces haynaldii]|nr:mitochondrial ATP synthase epsilon chain-domain-containing protein [Gorgonomyces haynaldii]
MTFWKEAGFSYLRYANVGARTLRSVLKAEPKVQALKREEVLLKQAIWKDGKMGENKYIVGPKE